MGGWILGVQKLTESHGVLLWFEGAFVKLEPPEGTGVGMKGGCRGLGYSLSLQRPTSFPAVSASQVCERQYMCVFERETHVQSMTHCIVIIYCGNKAGAQK